MIVNPSRICPNWPVLVALLILTASCGILFGGIKEMIKYDNANKLEVDYNIVNLHFFTRVYLTRIYQKFTAKQLPTITTLPSFNLFVDEEDLESLELDLPASAKLQYKQSHIKIDNPDFSGEAKIRYRGGISLHWLYEKKSIRVKLPPFKTYRNERKFNLVNPSTITTLTDMVSYDMARSIGLLTPEYFPARVFINHEYNGLHFFLSNIDESFLRKNNRMPGSIYSGDTVYHSNPHLENYEKSNTMFFNDDGTPAMWNDHRIWQKDASRNAESSDDLEDIKMFVEIINEADPLEFLQAFATYFNKQNFYLFWALDYLVGSSHHDLFHNHKIYFDPYKGKFEPIEWDIRFWSMGEEDLPVTPLFKQILLNPILKYEVDSVSYKLWNIFTVNTVIDMIDDANNTIAGELAADPYRIQPDDDNLHFGLNKEVPFSMEEYADAIEDIKQTYKRRHKYVEQEINLANGSYFIDKQSDDQFEITIAIDGNSPVDFDPWSIVPESLHEEFEIFRVYQDKTQPVLNNGEMDRLYPGIAINKKPDPEYIHPLRIAMYGLESYASSPLYYQYLIKGMNSDNLVNSKELTSRNSINSNIVTIKKVVELSSNRDSSSLHPWRLLLHPKSKNNEIILAGEIEAYYDLVFTEEQKVTILPGTTFKLYNNVSIYFYGEVIAKGTAELPIRFQRMMIDEPWGSIVIQGKKASASHLSHINISGGSVALHNLIHYPGQLNIHDVESFQIDNCHISNNTIGDDALHVAYSSGKIQHCVFENTAFDALDMDIVDVIVSDSKFFNIGNDAIDLMNSKTMINNVSIMDSGDKCISVGEASHVTVHNSQLENCQIGIAIKDQSIAEVENIKFLLKPGNAIALYRKNPRYSKGGEIHGSRLHGITEKDIVVGDYSVNNLQKNAYLPSNSH
ncbi:MAG: hypothetical protein ACI9XC_000463 [Gammaproteobacteria bacterium]|jgi:hypothetical protein